MVKTSLVALLVAIVWFDQRTRGIVDAAEVLYSTTASFIPTEARITSIPIIRSGVPGRRCEADRRFAVYVAPTGTSCNARGSCSSYCDLRYGCATKIPRSIRRQPFALFAINDNEERRTTTTAIAEEDATTSPEIYQNLVAKVLSNFMSKSNGKRNKDSTTKYESADDRLFFERRNAIMNDVLQQQQSDEHWNQPKLSLPIDVLARVLDYEIYEKEWFVTGHVNPIYFSSTNFTFQDPDVKMDTIRSYATGVQQIFDYQKTARAELISTMVNPDSSNSIITCTWRLSGTVNIGPGLTIKPYIVYTDFTICNDTGLIVYQKDRFDIPSWDILLSAIFPFLIGRITTPPAPKPPLRTPIMPDISLYI